MEERPCPCGGTFRSLGRQYLRLGEVPTGVSALLMGISVWNTNDLPVELLVCDRCRELKLVLPEDVSLPPPPPPEKTPVDRYKQNFAGFSARKLRSIADSDDFSPAARQAARELLKAREE